MAQNVTIAGASYPGVPSIAVPKMAGGTALFVDTSDANAAAGDITKGKTAYVGGTKITGTLEASSSGAAKETWVLEKTPSVGRIGLETTINFTSNDTKYSKIQIGNLNAGGIRYDDTQVYDLYVSDDENHLWVSSAYRKLTFDTPPTGDLLTWLQANGVKQPDDTAVQDSKALTITSNGTVSVTPDAPYDALKKVDVTVDVASGGSNGFKVTFPATAANWDMVNIEDVDIFLADGTTKSVIDYSTIGGKTIENVAGIRIFGGNPYYVLRMTLSAGEIAQFQVNVGVASYVITTAPNATVTPYHAGRLLFWWPLSDVVISAIEMYNTD